MAKKNEIAAVNALAVFGAANDGPLVPIVESGGSSPYAKFLHSRNTDYREILKALPDVEEGQPILVQGNEYAHLKPFKFIVCPLQFQFWGQFDASGNIMQAKEPESGVREKKPWRMCVETVLLVYEGETFHPARVRFTGPKCPGITGAINNTNDVFETDWSKRSPEQKVTAQAATQAKLPKWAWVMHTGALTLNTPKSSDGDATDYYELSTSATPISVAEIAALHACLKDEIFSKTLQACIDEFNSGNDGIKRKMTAA